MAGYTGYLTGFNAGTARTLVNHSTQRGKNVLSTAVDVNARIETLPNGTKANYDATAGAPRIPGMVTQDIYMTTGAAAFWAAIEADLGKQGTLTLTTIAAAAKTCTAVFVGLENITQQPITSRDAMAIRFVFDCLTEFS